MNSGYNPLIQPDHSIYFSLTETSFLIHILRKITVDDLLNANGNVTIQDIIESKAGEVLHEQNVNADENISNFKTKIENVIGHIERNVLIPHLAYINDAVSRTSSNRKKNFILKRLRDYEQIMNTDEYNQFMATNGIRRDNLDIM
uniref:Late expression factor 11 n=1 Tax=Meloidogyne hapla TaxID=6305 RepID=A0A1I8BUX4_MELHA